MKLHWLELTGFRSYARLRLEPAPDVNLLIGPNGAGKSNIVEAIAYLSRLRSFRGVPDAALVRVGEATAVVRGEFTNASTRLVEVELAVSARRRVLVDGKRPRRYSELAALVKVVSFQPDDVTLVKGGPALRRGYLDELAAALSAVAGGESEEYAGVLRQRNALLRTAGREADRAQLEAWEAALAAAGAAVLRRRLALADTLVPVLAAVYGEIGSEPVDLAWRYHSAGLGPLPDLEVPDDVEDRLMDAYAAARRRDMERRLTTVGPHRDDVALQLGSRDARTQASQGEQRTLALALRLAAFDVVAVRSGDRPILLLDDVFSELDEAHAAGVVRRLPDTQVFITSARPQDVGVAGREWRVGVGGVA